MTAIEAILLISWYAGFASLGYYLASQNNKPLFLWLVLGALVPLSLLYFALSNKNPAQNVIAPSMQENIWYKHPTRNGIYVQFDDRGNAVKRRTKDQLPPFAIIQKMPK